MSWQTPENLSADAIVDLFTGTPDGTLFLRDDGTLAAPSGGGTDASALTTGTLAAARLPGVLANVDTQGELLSAAAAAPIASPTFTGTVTSQSTTQTGALQWTGTQSSAGAAIANVYRDSSGNLIHNVATPLKHNFHVNGSTQCTIGTDGIVMPASMAGSNVNNSIITTSSNMYLRTGGTSANVIIRTGTTTDTLSLGVSGVLLGTWNSAPATTASCLWNGSGPAGPVLQGPTSAYAYLTANGSSAPRVFVSGTGAGLNAGGTSTEGSATSVANSGTKTVKTSATALSGFAEVVDTTNSRVALYSIEAGVPTKISGHTQFVAGAPGAGEVGLELSTTTLRINNGSGGALLLGAHTRLF